jgi:hypothetical protein
MQSASPELNHAIEFVAMNHDRADPHTDLHLRSVVLYGHFGLLAHTAHFNAQKVAESSLRGFQARLKRLSWAAGG